MTVHITPSKARLAAIVTDLALKGCDLCGIANILYAREIRTPRGTIWDEQDVGFFLDQHYIPHDPETTKEEIIQVIKALMETGLKYEKIAGELNKGGYVTKRGKAFNVHTVKDYYNSSTDKYQKSMTAPILHFRDHYLDIVREMRAKGTGWQDCAEYLNFSLMFDYQGERWHRKKLRELTDKASIQTG